MVITFVIALLSLHCGNAETINPEYETCNKLIPLNITEKLGNLLEQTWWVSHTTKMVSNPKRYDPNLNNCSVFNSTEACASMRSIWKLIEVEPKKIYKISTDAYNEITQDILHYEITLHQTSDSQAIFKGQFQKAIILEKDGTPKPIHPSTFLKQALETELALTHIHEESDDTIGAFLIFSSCNEKYTWAQLNDSFLPHNTFRYVEEDLWLNHIKNELLYRFKIKEESMNRHLLSLPVLFHGISGNIFSEISTVYDGENTNIMKDHNFANFDYQVGGHGSPHKELIALSKRKSSQENNEDKVDETNIFKNVEHFDNQMGGHEHPNKNYKFSGKNQKLGILKHPDGYLLKLVSKIKHKYPEAEFYEALRTSRAPVLKELKQFVPQYFGIKNIEINNEILKCVSLEDVTRGMELPCILDIKMGYQIWEPTDPIEKIERRNKKYIACRERWKFHIAGVQYHDITAGRFVRAAKNREMTPEETIKEIFNFLNGQTGIKYGLVSKILKQLRELRSWFQTQTFFNFHSSSILITYDAGNLKNFMMTGESMSDSESGPNIRITFIDFTHIIRKMDRGLDNNFLPALEKSIEFFENLPELYASTI